MSKFVSPPQMCGAQNKTFPAHLGKMEGARKQEAARRPCAPRAARPTRLRSLRAVIGWSVAEGVTSLPGRRTRWVDPRSLRRPGRGWGEGPRVGACVPPGASARGRLRALRPLPGRGEARGAERAGRGRGVLCGEPAARGARVARLEMRGLRRRPGSRPEGRLLPAAPSFPHGGRRRRAAL